jgi:hypothetical protein
VPGTQNPTANTAKEEELIQYLFKTQAHAASSVAHVANSCSRLEACTRQLEVAAHPSKESSSKKQVKNATKLIRAPVPILSSPRKVHPPLYAATETAPEDEGGESSLAYTVVTRRKQYQPPKNLQEA